MSLHQSTASLLKESLPEFLIAAEYCVNFRKKNRGCLGCPGAALMFSIADSLGSYHRKRSDFAVTVDGRITAIKRADFQHFFIFNSVYYGLALSEMTIRSLYNNYRSLLLHNSALVLDGRVLFMGEPSSDPFLTDGLGLHVNVTAFFRVTKNAVGRFLGQIDKIVPGSDQEQIIRCKQ